MNITIDDSITSWINNNLDKLTPELDRLMKETTADSLRLVKTNVSKRSGALAKSYISRKIGRFEVLIYPRGTEKYAEGIESGYRAHIIYPKKTGGRLTIPLRDSVLTNTKAQISKPALDNLFRMLKANKGKNRRSLNEIYQDAGIRLAKKVNVPAFSGTHKIEHIIAPAIRKNLENKTLKLLEGMF